MQINSIIEIIEVMAAYFTLIILLTSFMLKPITKNKSIFTKFLIYLVVGNFYIINIVYVLAYLHIFNQLVLALSLVFISVFIRIILDKEDAKLNYLKTKEAIVGLINGEYGKKLFLIRKIQSIKLKLKSICIELFKGRIIEWAVFLSVLSYNIYYYSYNSIKYISFGAPDEEVHLYWIQSLIRGKIFPSGVYPHGFHNILSAISVLFGINAATVINYFSIVSMIFIMTMLYFGLRKILKSKYAALLGFMAYSLLNVFDIEAIYRFQFSIPQEYGMIMLMPMAIFLFKYLSDKKLINLVLFGMCFSMTVSIHFYISIIAICLTISICIVYFYIIIKKRLFFKLLVCGIISIIIAIAPLATGVALGNEVEQSMDWAVRVIQGKEYDDEVTDEQMKDSFNWNIFINEAQDEITKHVVYNIKVMYTLIILILLTIMYNIFMILLKRSKEVSLYQLSFALNQILLILLILCRPLQISTVMESKRVAIFFAYYSPIFIAMQFEVLYRTYGINKTTKKIISGLTFIAIPVAFVLIFNNSLIKTKPPFYYFQTKGAMLVDNNIIKNYNDFTWTIVSPVNDISVILNNGYHYELSNFILQQENWNEEKEIIIPTKYVFIYIEKRPIINYGNYFYHDDIAITNRELVSYDDAIIPLESGLNNNEYYKEYRSILMSKAYYWAKEYIKYFPNEMNIYYEDDEIVVYRIIQNEYALNNFVINYGVNGNE